jgi:hypothetical protein
MNHSSGSDEGIAVRTGIGYVHSGASPGYGNVDRQHTAGEIRQHIAIEPRAKNAGLEGIATLHKQNSPLKLQNANGREKK